MLYNKVSSDLRVSVGYQTGAEYFEKLNTSAPATFTLVVEGNKKLETKVIQNIERKGMLRLNSYGKSTYKNVNECVR